MDLAPLSLTRSFVGAVALAASVHGTQRRLGTREHGESLWQRFAPRTAEDQVWYYGELVAFFAANRPGPLTEDLKRAVDELRSLLARRRGT
ncbi:MAG: hypothetical protein ABSG43_08365 [Solirubrobacteraceae bacterium]|jgi:hypothetical protein